MIDSRIGAFVLCALLFACSNATQEQPVALDKEDISPLIHRAFTFHGGLDRVDSIRFIKHTVLYDKAGNVELEQKARHVVHPNQFSGYWLDSLSSQTTSYSPAGVTKSDEAVETERLVKSARASFFTATLPWRLQDAGATLIAHSDTTVFGKSVEVVEADYGADQYAEPWFHYFEKSSGRHAGYLVDHGKQQALVHNVRDTSHLGLILPTYRITYRVADTLPRWVRGRFTYRYF